MITPSNSDEARLNWFVFKYLDTLAKWDVGRFFNENPFAVETAENVAAFSRRSPEQVSSVLHEMANDGLIIEEPREQINTYRLTEDGQFRALLSAFFLACDDREFRAHMLHDVIERGG
ncbi:MAG: hypothetical protein UZ15_CFX003000565 [Chloroflexi bacterium OLB15]|nr:MAG: hypothetical protein UZ15_CFX003000565 [Chloroflexi bacterium OLB15]